MSSNKLKCPDKPIQTHPKSYPNLVQPTETRPTKSNGIKITGQTSTTLLKTVPKPIQSALSPKSQQTRPTTKSDSPTGSHGNHSAKEKRGKK